MSVVLLLLALRAAPLPPPRDIDDALERECAIAVARTNARFAERERAMLEQFRRDVSELTPRNQR